LNDSNWSQAGSLATRTLSTTLNAGESTTVTISFIVNGSVTGSVVNWAEISTDDGNDSDSTPDQSNGLTGESTVDNEINNGS